MERKQTLKLDTMYFSLFEISEGVYAAIEKEHNTGSNAGIIDLGDSTVIFDTFLNIDAARELMRAAEMLTGRTAGYVINSHFHTDHFIGNCLFPESTKIISTESTRNTIAQAKQELAAEKDQYNPRIKEIYDIFKSGESIDNVEDLNNELLFLSNLVKPGVEIRIPDVTIDKGMIIHGSKRSLHLKVFDVAHSQGDMIAYLPEDKICFMGDLLSQHGHPWLGSGDPKRFIEALEEILRYDVVDYVSGHGGLSTKIDVLSQIQYINEMIHLVKTKNSSNISDYSLNDLSPMFREWRSLCFAWNINFLIEKMKNNSLEEKVNEGSSI